MLWTNVFEVFFFTFNLKRVDERKATDLKPRGFSDGKNICDMANVCDWRHATDEGSTALLGFLTL